MPGLRETAQDGFLSYRCNKLLSSLVNGKSQEVHSHVSWLHTEEEKLAL